MSELFLAIRDAIGINSTVMYQNKSTLIKDLPAGSYNLYHRKEIIGVKLTPNKIPGFLLAYCLELGSNDFPFKGKSMAEMISNLEIMLK